MSGVFDKGTRKELRPAATLLTGTLDPSAELDVSTFSMVTLDLVGTLGTGGSSPTIEVHPEVAYDRTGTTWLSAVSAQNAGTPASGAVGIELCDVTYTMTAAGSRTVHIPVYGAVRFRVSARETGGPLPFGTCQVGATPSRLGV